jgi:1-acyl-sn-glycerol-3-phosphate acyltransferase
METPKGSTALACFRLKVQVAPGVMNSDFVEPRTPLQKALGMAMWVPGLTWLTMGMGTLMVLQRFLPSHRIEPLTRIYTRGQILAAASRLRYVVHPDVDPKGVYMFAQNHVNLLDHCTMYNSTPHFKQGIELASHFKLPVYGWFMKQRGTIPVYRDRGQHEMMAIMEDRMRQEVARGHSLLVFPEGTRTTNGRVSPFRTGVLKLGYRLGLPIVPVAVTGMFEVLRKDENLIVPGGNVTVYVEQPIETKGVTEREFPALVRRVRDIVAARVDDYYRARAQNGKL